MLFLCMNNLVSMINKSYTKQQLAIAYGVTEKVFRRWLKDLSELIVTGRNQYLSPKEITVVVAEYGEPDWSKIDKVK